MVCRPQGRTPAPRYADPSGLGIHRDLAIAASGVGRRAGKIRDRDFLLAYGNCGGRVVALEERERPALTIVSAPATGARIEVGGERGPPHVDRQVGLARARAAEAGVAVEQRPVMSRRVE